MLEGSRDGIRVRVRIGGPSKSGEFIGLALDQSITLPAIIVGGAIAVGIVWITTQRADAKPKAIEQPSNITPVRGITASS